MTNDPNKKRGGYSYHYSTEQIQEFQKLSYVQRLQWVESMNKFLNRFMPPESKLIQEKLRRGENCGPRPTSSSLE